MGAWGASGGSSILPTPTKIMKVNNNIRSAISNISKNKLLTVAVLLTFFPFVIWSFGAVSYIWAIISNFVLTKLPVWTTVFFLLVAPFLAFFLSLINYLNKKDKLSKKLFLLNLVFISLSIISSLLFS